MGSHHCAIKSEVDARTTNARVPLNVEHPELGQQTGYRHTLEIIPNSRAIRYPQLSHALLYTVHTCMSVINDCGLNECRWSNLRMSMQHIR